MLISTIDYNEYVGRIGIGKVDNGGLKVNQECVLVNHHDPDKFKNQKAEEIVARYSGQIRQDDLDDIVDRELKFFILADEDRWGFTVVPVLRREGQLQLGPDQFFRFETEGWVTNFFDGTK